VKAGARLSGGGFGGAVLALTGSDFDATSASQVAVRYAKRFGTEPEILSLQCGNGARVIHGLGDPV
jgi:galactokinase